MTFIETLFTALGEARVRYVAVGGIATVLHGYERLTADVDLVVDLAPAEARRAIDVLTALGLRPWAPVNPLDFCDPEQRSTWVRERNMLVFTMVDPKHPLRIVDLFVESPVDFDALWQRAATMTLGASSVRVASLPDLIAMKRRAGRPKDLDDVARLEAIARRTRGATDV